MNTRFVKSWYLFLLLAASCCTATVSKPEFRYAVPVSGNSWVIGAMDARERIITRKGIENWDRAERETPSAIRETTEPDRPSVEYPFAEECYDRRLRGGSPHAKTRRKPRPWTV